MRGLFLSASPRKSIVEFTVITGTESRNGGSRSLVILTIADPVDFSAKSYLVRNVHSLFFPGFQSCTLFPFLRCERLPKAGTSARIDVFNKPADSREHHVGDASAYPASSRVMLPRIRPGRRDRFAKSLASRASPAYKSLNPND